jgi:carbon-monoxide dehydrogenase medium subunit
VAFAYYEPATLDEAYSILAQEGDGAAPLAGGTDLLLQLRRRLRSYRSVVNLKSIGLNGISFDPEQGLRFGALTTFRAIERSPVVQMHYPSLVEAAAVVAGVQLRNIATVGGNLGNASPSADSVPPLVALGATVTVRSPRGSRTLPIEQCFAGPGKTVLAPDELFTSVQAPAPPARSGNAYQRFTPRSAMDIAVVSVGAFVALDEGGRCTFARIALGAVSPVPLRATRAEEALLGEELSESLVEEAGRLASEAARPISDIRGGADYRRTLTGVLTRRMVSLAAQRARENGQST